MAVKALLPVVQLLNLLKQTSSEELWLDYEKEADVLYINLQRPLQADDSEMSEDGTVIRYQEGKIIGYTLLNASSVTGSA